MDSKASTPFSQALRISRMAAEMLRQASCHFICLHGDGGGRKHHHRGGWAWAGLRERAQACPHHHPGSRRPAVRLGPCRAELRGCSLQGWKK